MQAIQITSYYGLSPNCDKNHQAVDKHQKHCALTANLSNNRDFLGPKKTLGMRD